MTKSILVTGAAGFIGFHLSKQLLSQGYNVVGIDNINDYYDVQLKKDRLKILKENQAFNNHVITLENKEEVLKVFKSNPPFHCVVNLAAQAGVRYSIENPNAYVESNVIGFLNVLEGCRYSNARHLIYASSSSVYGANTRLPFSVHDNVDHPLSLYAATKKSNELMAHTYSSLYQLPTTGLRFFTVYGPYGRPDMALFLFTKAIIEGNPIKVFNNGEMKRDFTYVSDIVEGISRLVDKVPTPNQSWSGNNPDTSSSFAPYRLYNIGNNSPVDLMDFIYSIEEKLGKKAVMEMLPLQDGDVPETYANVENLVEDIGFKPDTSIKEGISNFIDWYLDYYNIKI